MITMYCITNCSKKNSNQRFIFTRNIKSDLQLVQEFFQSASNFMTNMKNIKYFVFLHFFNNTVAINSIVIMKICTTLGYNVSLILWKLGHVFRFRIVSRMCQLEEEGSPLNTFFFQLTHSADDAKAKHVSQVQEDQ